MTGRAASPLDCLPDLGREAVHQLAARHLDALTALGGSADRIVDKMPENTLYLGLIAYLVSPGQGDSLPPRTPRRCTLMLDDPHGARPLGV